MNLNQEHGKAVLRISLSLVFLWFGINQLYSPADWTGFVPSLLSKIASPDFFVIVNGIFEVLLGTLLLTGFYVRIVSLLLGLHLFLISFSLGYSAIAIRDYGLAFASLALFFIGPDKFCLDKEQK